jgi:hypothetical protein
VVNACAKEELVPARGSRSQNEHQVNNIAELRNEGRRRMSAGDAGVNEADQSYSKHSKPARMRFVNT